MRHGDAVESTNVVTTTTTTSTTTSHEEKAEAKEESSANKTTSTPRTSKATVTTTVASPAAETPPSQICGICLEDPQPLQRKFGLLSCCNHAFCFDCLMEWRKEGSNEAQDRRNCPTCRKHSDYVVPSVCFAVDDQKEAIVADYKHKLARIPCRYFNGRLKSCPFGRDCFYAHLKDGQDVKDLDESMEVLHQERRRRRQRQRRQQQQRHYTSHMEDDVEMINALLVLLDLYSSSPRTFLFEDSDDEFSFLD